MSAQSCRPAQNTGGLKRILIPAVFTFLGDEKVRIDLLRFMVITNLIADPEIRRGVSAYLPPESEVAQRTVPQYVPLVGQQRAADSQKIDDAVAIAKMIWAGRYDSVRVSFNDLMAQSLSADQIKEGALKFIEPLGNLVSTVPSETFAENGDATVNVRCIGQKGQLSILVSYDSSGKIGGLWITAPFQ